MSPETVHAIHELHGGDIGIECRENGFRFRPLQGQEGPVVMHNNLHTCRKLCPEMGDIGILAAGIDHDKQPVAQPRDHQVIEDAAVFVGEEAVALATVLEAEDIDRNERFQRLGGIIIGAGGGDDST